MAPLPRLCRRVSAGRRRRISFAAVLVALGLVLAACGAAAPTGLKDPTSRASTTTMIEYVGGHWVPFTSAKALSATEWNVVDAYANFSTAVLAVYSTRSVAPLATVVSAQSKVTAMFARDLATGTDPEALYTKATVESVATRGCRAELTSSCTTRAGGACTTSRRGYGHLTGPPSPPTRTPSTWCRAGHHPPARALPPWRRPNTHRGSSSATTGSEGWTRPAVSDAW